MWWKRERNEGRRGGGMRGEGRGEGEKGRNGCEGEEWGQYG